MLIRVFRGVIRPGAHEALLTELHDSLRVFESHPDVLYSALGLPSDASPDEYLFETHWRSQEALVAFAGEDWMSPRVEPCEEELIVSVSAHHYVTDELPVAGGTVSRIGSPVLGPCGVEVDPLRNRLRWDAASVFLPPREMSAMLALAADPGAPVTSGELARTIWPGSVVVSAYDVRRVIHRLRGKLRAGGIPLTIRNVHGSGYCVEPAPWHEGTNAGHAERPARASGS